MVGAPATRRPGEENGPATKTRRAIPFLQDADTPHQGFGFPLSGRLDGRDFHERRIVLTLDIGPHRGEVTSLRREKTATSEPWGWPPSIIRSDSHVFGNVPAVEVWGWQIPSDLLNHGSQVLCDFWPSLRGPLARYREDRSKPTFIEGPRSAASLDLLPSYRVEHSCA